MATGSPSRRRAGKVGPLHVSIDAVRDHATPFNEIRSHQIKGDLKASDLRPASTPRAGDARTVSGKLVAGAWASWAFGAETIAAHTRRQYQELRNEILRRKTL
jgi:hypothetical protein